MVATAVLFSTLSLGLFLFPPSVNVVNIGGDYEIGRFVCSSLCLCVCVHVFEAPYVHNGAR